MEAQNIIDEWLKVFPNGHASSRTILGSTCVRLYLQHAKDCINGIQENDPLRYSIWIEGENVYESDLYILTRPPEGSNLVYGSAKKRKQAIKSADCVKLAKRFRNIRAWILSQELKHDVVI